MAEIFRAPGIAPKRSGLPKAASFDPPNILLSVLVITAPFVPVQLPAPANPIQVHRHFEPPVLLASTLKPAAGPAPFQPVEWSNAAPGRPRASSFDPPNFLLSEFAPTSPFFEPQWPSAPPKLPKATAFDPPDLSFTTLASVKPFLNWDNPVPIRVRLKAASFDPPNLILSEFVPTRPFFEPQWYGTRPKLPKAVPFELPGPPASLLNPPVIPVPAADIAYATFRIESSRADFIIKL